MMSSRHRDGTNLALSDPKGDEYQGLKLRRESHDNSRLTGPPSASAAQSYASVAQLFPFAAQSYACAAPSYASAAPNRPSILICFTQTLATIQWRLESCDMKIFTDTAWSSRYSSVGDLHHNPRSLAALCLAADALSLPLRLGAFLHACHESTSYPKLSCSFHRRRGVPKRERKNQQWINVPPLPLS